MRLLYELVPAGERSPAAASSKNHRAGCVGRTSAPGNFDSVFYDNVCETIRVIMFLVLFFSNKTWLAWDRRRHDGCFFLHSKHQ